MYDIESDRARTAVAKACKRAGLYRVQLSVFLGSLSATEFDELRLEIEDRVDVDKDKVYLFTMSKSELRRTVLLGQAFDKKLVTDEVRALFI
jgi:CRISPR-associated protein Cas2